jgi:glycosyltransferase involved in cell wall biosynthesis
MTRVALVVEPFFADRHVGVRNYILSTAALLERAAQVEFVSFYRTESLRPMWYRIGFRHRRWLEDSGGPAFRGSGRQVLAAYRQAFSSQQAAPPPPPIVYTQIGNRIDREGFHLAVITNPWLLDRNDELPFPAQFGMAYDAIPPRYVLTNPANRPYVFAAEHAQGYKYFRTFCRATFCISPPVADDLRELYRFPARQVVELPPLLPPAYFDPALPEVRREPAVVLAGALDPRKGLADLPDLLNPLAPDRVPVLMYGGVRCSEHDLHTFFHNLDPRLPVEWHPRASADTVKKLFSRARLLLFPSLHEGLGLPVLEAQYCGCRVLARPIDPVARLLLTGSILYRGNPWAVRESVRRAVFDDRFPHGALRSEAIARFRPERVAEVLLRALDLGRYADQPTDAPAETVAFPMAKTA